MPRSLAELGIERGEFEAALPELADAAFADPSLRTNPRMPLLSELLELLEVGGGAAGEPPRGRALGARARRHRARAPPRGAPAVGARGRGGGPAPPALWSGAPGRVCGPWRPPSGSRSTKARPPPSPPVCSPASCS